MICEGLEITHSALPGNTPPQCPTLSMSIDSFLDYASPILCEGSFLPGSSSSWVVLGESLPIRISVSSFVKKGPVLNQTVRLSVGTGWFLSV